jgi:hypothetical protein
MKKYYIKYQFIVFLYAYLRQIDLSLARSRGESWNHLQEYYKNQISPVKVVDYLVQNTGLKPNKESDQLFVDRINRFIRIKYLLLRIIHLNSFLTKEELDYCYDKLLIFNQYLNCDREIDIFENEKLRIEIGKINYQFIEHKLFLKDRETTMRVEHYLQNETLKTIPIEDFIKNLPFKTGSN